MDRRRFTGTIAATIAATLVPAHAATMVTEIFTVAYRPLDEVIPLLQPLVPSPGSVGGLGDQLVIRTTPENMEDIRRILDTINRAPANLLISVRSGVDSHSATTGIESYGTRRIGEVEIGRGEPTGERGVVIGDSRSGVRVLNTRSASDDRGVQRVRVLEGQEAFIRSGQSVPVADRNVVITGIGTTTIQQGVRYRDVTSGFYVRPRLSGDQVTLEISPHSQRMSQAGGGAIDVAGASTVVSGRLGEWIAIGGVTQEGTSSLRGIGASTRSSGGREYGTFVKVERLD